MTKIYKLSKGWETIYPATTSDAVVHPGTRTSINKLFNEINVSVVYPTSGIGRTNKYSLEGAIAQVPQELRNIGLKVSFLNNSGLVETWEFAGGAFENIENWKSNEDKLTDIRDEAIDKIKDAESDAISNFSSQRVTPDMLSESTKQFINASGGGTINNLADDEDLVSVDKGENLSVP